jgi:hypothetical protein
MLCILNGCGSVVYVACSGQAQAPGGAGETTAGGAVEKTAGNFAFDMSFSLCGDWHSGEVCLPKQVKVTNRSGNMSSNALHNFFSCFLCCISYYA